MNTAPISASASRRKGWIATLLGAALAVAVLSYLLQDISIGEVFDLIGSADRRAVAIFALLSLAGSVARTWRYSMLLAVQGYFPPHTPLFLIVLVRNFCADLLPARLGTLVYVALVNRRLGVPLHTATTTWTQSLLFDLLAMPPLVCIAALASDPVGGMSPWLLAGGGVFLALIFTLVLLALPAVLRRGADIFTGMRGRISSAAPSMRRVAADLELTRRSGIYGRVLILSVLIRIFKYASLYVFLFALLRPLGFGLTELRPGLVFLGLVAAELSASLPISGIAGFGAYQGAWVLVFQLLGFDLRIAKMTSLSHHLFTQLYGYGLGIAAAGVLCLPIFRRSAASRRTSVESPGPARFTFGLASFVSAVILAAWGISLLAAPADAAKRGIALTPDEANSRRTLLAQIAAPIVFDSNRSGTFGIYILRGAEIEPEPLNDTLEQEMYPDPSPDGRSVVFARAVSSQRQSPSDLWIVELESRRERKVASDGTFPTFSSDGRRIYFERGRRALWEIDLQSGVERKLLDGGEPDSLVKPRISADGTQVLFTGSRMGGWQVLQGNLASGAIRVLAPGCEAGWESDSAGIYWIKMQGARSGSGVYRRDVAPDGAEEALADRDNPWGHEYFPVSACGDRFLLWSSSSEGGHSHITADYQLFARNRGTGVTARLTADGYTNRWAKIVGCP